MWNSEGLTGGGVIVCESLIDALELLVRRFPQRDRRLRHRRLHRRARARRSHSSRAQRCLIAYDHDDAGDAAAEKLAAELMATGVECLRVVFPWGADANDVAVAADDARRELGRYLARGPLVGAGTPADNARCSRHEPVFWAFWARGRERAPGRDSDAGLASPACGRLRPDDRRGSPPRRGAASSGECAHAAQSARRPGRLRVNLMVGSGERFHVDTVDLYAARQRARRFRRGGRRRTALPSASS